MAPFVSRLRALVGNELLVLPSVAVIPFDSEGRVLLARDRVSGNWMTIGGAIEPDESPETAATREASEEAAVSVDLDRLIGLFGGPEFRTTYPNGDQVSYVTAVYAARLAGGSPEPDGDEVSELGWWSTKELHALEMSDFTKALLRAAKVLGNGSAAVTDQRP